MKLTVASFLSDRIVDEILDALSHCHHKLVSAVGIGVGHAGSSSAMMQGRLQFGGRGSLSTFYSFAVLWARVLLSLLRCFQTF